MKTTSLILLSSITISTISCRQSKSTDCAMTLDKVPYFATHIASTEHDSILLDYQILKECGQLDSIDTELFNGPILGSIMVTQAAVENEVTYRTILNNIKEFKKTPDYKILRDTKILENKIANLYNWEKDKQSLMSAGIPESEIENLREFIRLNSEEKMTFKEAYAGYMASKPQEQKPETTKLNFTELVDLDNAIKSGRLNKKTVLIYFTSHADANSRDMEVNILTNEQIKTLITDNFVYFSAYVDERRRDPNDNSTIGSKYLKLQTEKFKSNYQPNFIIIDDKGEIIASQGYTSKADEFMDFLKKGIK